MVAVTSNMLELGTEAPPFELPDFDGNVHQLIDARGSPTLIMFICNHCPFVKFIADDLAEVARIYGEKGVRVFGINSNDVERYPADGPDAMREESARRGYQFPYLLDETQEVAKTYMAACTPDFFLFDANHRLAYRGQFDDSRPSNGLLTTGSDLRAALDAVLDGRAVPEPQKPSIGCNIKWKPGNEPPYFG